jgi:hypothetical protein
MPLLAYELYMRGFKVRGCAHCLLLCLCSAVQGILFSCGIILDCSQCVACGIDMMLCHIICCLVRAYHSVFTAAAATACDWLQQCYRTSAILGVYLSHAVCYLSVGAWWAHRFEAWHIQPTGERVLL